MAPIFEKRSQIQNQPVMKDGGQSYVFSHGIENTHGKENSTSKHSKKGLEILDFHESWLEEMELYKDQMVIHKNQHHMLGSHNHIHTPQGCQIESNMSTNGVISGPSSTINVDNNSINLKKKNLDVNIKSKIILRNSPVSVMSSIATNISVGNDSKSSNANLQLILKRPREDVPTNKSPVANVKRHAHSHTHANNPQTHGYNPVKNMQTSNTLIQHATTSSVTAKQSTKIIVNQFHASSLLSSHQNEDKTKILTQNGLTKSAATAYETSLYASHYLPQHSRSNYNNFSSGKFNVSDNAHYVGVSLAKLNDSDKSKDSNGNHNTDDDPCAAIDDVNDYSDSDSEEEYTGYPFYLVDDGKEVHQSCNIRITSERSSEDTEVEHSEYYTPSAILSPSIFPNVPPYLNFSSHAEKGPSMPATLHKVLKWKLSPVMPKIVKRVVLNSGFRIIKNTTDWMAIWEKHMKSPGFRTIRSHQKYNHMPGSFRIGRKDTMWRSIYNNMKKHGTKEFGFMQKSYIMPDDLESLRQVWPKNASKLTKWIVKPPASARGTGIRIVNKWSQFPKDRPLVVQKYIEKPLLINDNKFDMRIYVVVTSINPLRIYMYKDGLARFASVKYSSELNSLDDRCMHLTNYSINKFSQNYSKNEDFNACQGHKWTLQSLWSCLESRGVNTKRLWATLRNLVIKSIISGESGLNRMYRQNVNFRYNCFELFGFDVLLDENLIPWLLEINISPSLHSELPLDLHVKGPLIQAVLNTALYQVPPKLNEHQQNEILKDLDIKAPLCHDKRIFTTCLTAEEVRKHNQFTNRSIEFREEYIDAILENLLPDDIRCLIISEDEYARCNPLERVFPTPDTYSYLKYIDNPRYYNRLLDAWEHKYANCRTEGLALLSNYCREGYHLEVSDAALEKEPNVALTEIDMLHTKKSDDTLTPTTININGDDSNIVSKDTTPDLSIDSIGNLAPISICNESSVKITKHVKELVPIKVNF